MNHRDQATVTDRLRRGLLAFHEAQTSLLTAHREIKNWQPARVKAFWDSDGGRLEGNARITAAELSAAFKAFSEAGLVADTSDRHLVREAQRQLAESGQ